MDTYIIGKDKRGKWYCYRLQRISDIEARMLGLDKVEKAETRHKTKKP